MLSHVMPDRFSKKATVAFSGVMNYKRGSLKTSQFPCNVAISLRFLFLVLVCILASWGPKTLSCLFLLGSLTTEGISKIVGKLQNIFGFDTESKVITS